MMSVNQNHLSDASGRWQTPPGQPWPEQSLLPVIWRRRWTVASVLVIALAAAATYLAWVKPTYLAGSRISINPAATRTLVDMSNPVTSGSSANFLSTQCEMIKSSAVLKSALETLNSEKMKTFAGVDSPLDNLRKNLRVEAGKRDDLVNVSVEALDPQEAADLANGIVQAYINWRSDQKETATTAAMTALESQKQKLSVGIEQQVRTLAQGRRDNRSALADRQVVNLTDALATAQIETISSRTAYETAVEMINRPQSLKQLIEYESANFGMPALHRDLVEMQSNLAELESRQAQLNRRYLDGHPSVQTNLMLIQQVKDRIADIQKRFAQAYLAAAQRRITEAEKRQTEVQRALDRQQAFASEMNNGSVRHQLLESELNRTQRVCDSIDTRLKEAVVQQTIAAADVGIIERATPPQQPVRPNQAQVMGIGLIFGLVLGCGLAILRNSFDNRFRSTEEVVAWLNLPVLGVVPHIVGRKAPTAEEPDNNSEVIDACRTVRAALRFGAPDGQAKRLLVASPDNGDGRSVVAAGLAAALARAGQRVLLIDADLSKAGTNLSHADMSLDVGLTSVLSGMESMQKAVRQTAVAGLDLLGAGPAPQEDLGILESQAFADLLAKAGEEYDHVVLDSPHLNGGPDALSLAAQCDATLMVLRADHSIREEAELATQGLLSVGARIMGVVINDAPRKHLQSGQVNQEWYCCYRPRAASPPRPPRHKSGEGKSARTRAA